MNAAGSDRLRVATYNVHQWRASQSGADHARSLAVVAELDADLVALQEVSVPAGESREELEADIRAATGLNPLWGPTLYREDAAYGNALLCRTPPERVIRHNLSELGREPRGALEARFSFGGLDLMVLATHLGLRAWERRRQAERILRRVAGTGADAVLLLGDMNEWLPPGRASRRLWRALGPFWTPPTFPARLPLLPLDRILAQPARRIGRIRAHRSALARSASDHLPLVAELDLGP